MGVREMKSQFLVEKLVSNGMVVDVEPWRMRFSKFYWVNPKNRTNFFVHGLLCKGIVRLGHV